MRYIASAKLCAQQFLSATNPFQQHSISCVLEIERMMHSAYGSLPLSESAAESGHLIALQA